MSHFQLYDIDPDFDYFSEPLPNSCVCAFGDQLSRAREILKGRSAEELTYAFESLDWMLRKGGEHHLFRALKEAEAKGISFTNRAKALKCLKESFFDITDQAQFPKARWADYFAAFTLAVIGEQLLSDKSPPIAPEFFASAEEAKAYEKEARHSLLLERALEAMEAIYIAEALQNEPTEQPAPSDATSQTMRAQGQKGGMVRAARFSELKAKVISLSEQKYRTRSNRNAARRIYEAIAGEVDAVLTTDDPPKTLEKWIGDYRRQQRQVL